MKKVKLLALIFAVLTAIAVYFFLNQINKVEPEKTADVVVAVKAIGLRSTIDDGMIEVKKVPAATVHPLSATKKEQVMGLISDSRFEAGEQILTSKLIKSGQKTGRLSYVIPAGKRAMTVQVDNITGIAGFVQPGDFVDLLVTIMVPHNDGNTVKDKATSVLLRQNLEVLAVGVKMTDGGSQLNSTYDSVTLAVSPNDMVDINLAATQGKIRLVLRSPSEKDTITAGSKTAENLVR